MGCGARRPGAAADAEGRGPLPRDLPRQRRQRGRGGLGPKPRALSVGWRRRRGVGPRARHRRHRRRPGGRRHAGAVGAGSHRRREIGRPRAAAEHHACRRQGEGHFCGQRVHAAGFARGERLELAPQPLRPGLLAPLRRPGPLRAVVRRGRRLLPLRERDGSGGVSRRPLLAGGGLPHLRERRAAAAAEATGAAAGGPDLHILFVPRAERREPVDAGQCQHRKSARRDVVLVQ
mmetsp:Transcript_111261/g.321710  ORF Transcript_111261/g.321710 Transcript_111261/m.321710 type:complete len:233 (+) Transcript_111261:85-783(+)